MAHRISPEALNDLDQIVVGIAEQGGALKAAERLISAITERFHTLSVHPYVGRARDKDLGPGRRSHVVGNYVIIYRVDDGDVVILRVIHGYRDIEHLFD